MRVIAITSAVFTLALTFGLSARPPAGGAHEGPHQIREGRQIFRYDTFDDEQLWTDVLRMHEAIANVSPATALSVGLKVDVEALPQAVIDALKEEDIDLNDPAVTIELLRLNAVLGVVGKVGESGELQSIGITCALCHSSVDDSLTEGVGRRLDGWANTDLDVGKIVALSPVLDPGLKAELNDWGPGKYDPRHHAFNGTSIIGLNAPTLPIVIPPIYGLKNVGFETYTGDGPISYWNSYVGITQMGGRGTFRDPRIDIDIVQQPDLVTPKLPALLAYQLSLKTPEAPRGSFNRAAAARGKQVFRNEARCATCHSGSTMTDVLTGPAVPLLHAPSEVGTDPMYAERSATKKYRTTPLRALWQHAPYFHDGSATDLPAVVEHYNTQFSLNLTPAQKADLVEFLKSL